LKSETLAGLFYLSSLCPVQDKEALEDKLLRVKELIKKGILPFSMCEFEKSLEQWCNSGYEARHHSEGFNRLYQPSYRVIHKGFVPFVPLLERLDEMLEEGSVHMCIEGGSASGKSTLAQLLSEVYGCTVFHMDDFFLQPHQRTPERFAEAGGNVDYERFREEVMLPFSRGERVLYRRFDCSKMKILPPVEMKATRLTVTEGAYSMHPQLSEFYDLKVMLDIDKNLQKARITRRNPDIKDRFFNDWIPLEERYFEAFDIKNKCDMRIEIGEESL
jgi:deoxyadenosine/deoxycytidine kinase